jgi:hypothetical protein
MPHRPPDAGPLVRLIGKPRSDRQRRVRSGFLTKLERIDLPHRHAGSKQGAHDATLIAAARLYATRCDAQATQPVALCWRCW